MVIEFILLFARVVTYLGVVFLIALVVGMIMPLETLEAIKRHYARRRSRHRDEVLQLKAEYELERERRKEREARRRRRLEHEGATKKGLLWLPLLPFVFVWWLITIAPFEWGERLLVRFNEWTEDFLEPFDHFWGSRQN